ncbi:hypothetical protein ACA910_007690 [Epithemia clementina (nom. ined.)]
MNDQIKNNINVDEQDNYWLSFLSSTNATTTKLSSSSSPAPSSSTTTSSSTTSSATLLSTLLPRRLYDLEQTLRCSICRELFDIPVSLEPCHHSFCSACIRTSLAAAQKTRFSHQKPSCPICRTAIPDNAKSIVPNHALQATVQQFQLLRPVLRQTLLSQQQQQKQKQGLTDTSVEKTVLPEDDKNAPDLDAPSLLQQQSQQDNDPDSKKEPPLQRRRPYVYSHYKKRKQLQELCRIEGLSLAGSETELKERHAAFLLKVNAECDSRHPRTHAQVLAEFQAEEAARQGSSMTTTAALVHTLYETRRRAGEPNPSSSSSNDDNQAEPPSSTSATTPVVVTTGNRQVDETMNRNFAEMIRQLRAKKMMQQKQPNAKNEDKASGTCDQERAETDPNSTLVETDDEAGRHRSQRLDENNNHMPPTAPSLYKTPSSKTTLTPSPKSHHSTSSHQVTVSSQKRPLHQRQENEDEEQDEQQEEDNGAADNENETETAVEIVTTTSITTKAPTTLSSYFGSSSSSATTTRHTNKKKRRRHSHESSTLPPEPSTPRDGPPWTCPICTYHNIKSKYLTAKCEVCENPRPASSSSRPMDVAVATTI